MKHSPPSVPDTIVRSQFHPGIDPCFWNTTNSCELKLKSGKGDGSVMDAFGPEAKTTEYTFVCNNSDYTHLVYVDGCFVLPAFQVRPEYKDKVLICWSRNPATAAIVSAEMRVGSTRIPGMGFDKAWIDTHRQWRRDPSIHIQKHNEIAGNVPDLVDWNHSLPKTFLCAPHPWSFSREQSHAFPIHYWKDSDNVTLTYRVYSNIGSILRMAVRPDPLGPLYVLPSPDFKYLTTPDVETPQLIPIGRYSYATPDELGFLHPEARKVFRMLSVVAFHSRTLTAGATEDIHITTSLPCRAIFLCAENTKASAKNAHSTYTVSQDDMDSIVSPISHIAQYYGIIKKFSLPASYFGAREAKHFTCAPFSPGFFAIANCLEPDLPREESGIIYKSDLVAKITCKLSGGEEEIKSGSEYIIHVFALVDAYYTVTRGPGGDYLFEIGEIRDPVVPAKRSP